MVRASARTERMSFVENDDGDIHAGAVEAPAENGEEGEDKDNICTRAICAALTGAGTADEVADEQQRQE